jgi:hypothetical protein
MSSTMDGMRGRTVSRVNTARVDATRLAYIPEKVNPDDTKLYAWVQVRGPEAIEETVSWTEVSR